MLGEGRYRLQRRLGTGGMASVWLAVDERLGREVAVKVMADSLAADEQYRRRFAREARAAASVSDPHIVPVYDYGIEAGRPYLVMEYIPEGNLAARLSQDEASELDAHALAEQLLGALAHVHDAGLVHRDIKPANILLDRRGRVRLTDFGIAQAQDATGLTHTGMVVGTLRYLAPEVSEGAAATPSSDLYAAGVVLREVARRQPAAPLQPLIARLTADRPEDRPPSAQAARELLTDGAPTAQMPPTATVHRTGPALRSTGLTRIAPRRGGPTPADAVGRRRSTRGLPRETRWAIAAMAAVVLVIVIVAVASGGGSAGPRGAKPAAPSAPLSDQLRALDNIVSGATKP